MRIDEQLRGGEPIVSFEFSPPRTVEAELAFWARDRGAGRARARVRLGHLRRGRHDA